MTGWNKLGIIAGGGALPLQIVEACRQKKTPFHLIRLAGFADDALKELPGADIALGEFGALLRELKENACDAAVMAGIVKRPDFATLKLDWGAAMRLPKLLAAAARGDGAVLNLLVAELEADGVAVIGAEEAVEGLAAPAGPLGARSPSQDDFADIRKAASVIAALGPYDVGQAAVVARGLVLAIEAAEGTDAMLERCATLPEAVRGGVLVKCPKPGQDRRVDLPVIGSDTIRRAQAAGLSGVAVESGRALVMDRAEAIRLADAAGLFVYGYKKDEIDET